MGLSDFYLCKEESKQLTNISEKKMHLCRTDAITLKYVAVTFYTRTLSVESK